MRKSKQDVGRWGEEKAETYLIERGFDIIDRNIRTPYGEIDLVAREKECLVFVEVKTRTSNAFGYPEEAITAQKRSHILDSAQSYLQSHPEIKSDWRIDVIAVQTDSGFQKSHITHFENAITAF